MEGLYIQYLTKIPQYIHCDKDRSVVTIKMFRKIEEKFGREKIFQALLYKINYFKIFIYAPLAWPQKLATSQLTQTKVTLAKNLFFQTAL